MKTTLSLTREKAYGRFKRKVDKFTSSEIKKYLEDNIDFDDEFIRTGSEGERRLILELEYSYIQQASASDLLDYY